MFSWLGVIKLTWSLTKYGKNRNSIHWIIWLISLTSEKRSCCIKFECHLPNFTVKTNTESIVLLSQQSSQRRRPDYKSTPGDGDVDRHTELNKGQRCRPLWQAGVAKVSELFKRFHVVLFASINTILREKPHKYCEYSRKCCTYN